MMRSADSGVLHVPNPVLHATRVDESCKHGWPPTCRVLDESRKLTARIIDDQRFVTGSIGAEIVRAALAAGDSAATTALQAQSFRDLAREPCC